MYVSHFFLRNRMGSLRLLLTLYEEFDQDLRDQGFVWPQEQGLMEGHWKYGFYPYFTNNGG